MGLFSPNGGLFSGQTAAGGSGTVTSVSVAAANGFTGTVANPSTTPAITIIAGAINPTSVGVTTPSPIRGYRPSATTFNGTTGTLALTDAEYFQVCSNAATQTLTIPTNASVAFPIDTEIDFFQQGVGQVVFSAAGGVTIQNLGLKIASQFGGATLKKIATDTWLLIGDLSS